MEEISMADVAFLALAGTTVICVLFALTVLWGWATDKL